MSHEQILTASRTFLFALSVTLLLLSLVCAVLSVYYGTRVGEGRKVEIVAYASGVLGIAGILMMSLTLSSF